jgi:pilus assembly protein CpaF
MMATPIATNFTQLTSSDLLKFKRYLVDAVSRSLEGESLMPDNRAEFITSRLSEAYVQTKVNLPKDLRAQIFNDIVDELSGLGPIQPLLDDPDISEVMVNGAKKVFIEKNGKLMKSPVTFEDDNHVLRIIDRIILPLGRRVDADSPTVDARLLDGSRVNAVIPPVAIDGPSSPSVNSKKTNSPPSS